MNLKNILTTILLLGAIAILAQEPQVVTDLKEGKKTLECQFDDGWRTVPKDKIVGLDDEHGGWIFTNGYARNCEIY